MGEMGVFIGIFAFMGIAFVVIGIMLVASGCKQSKSQKGAMKISATVVDKYVGTTRHLRRTGGGAQVQTSVHGKSTVHINTYEYNDPQTGELRTTKNKWSSDEIKRQKIGDKVEIYVTSDGETIVPDGTKNTKLANGIVFIVLGVVLVLGIFAISYVIDQISSIPYQS